MTLVEAVARRTLELLKQNNMSQYKLIKETCLDKTTLQNILKNKTKDIKLSTVFLIASAFNMDIHTFTEPYYFKREEIET